MACLKPSCVPVSCCRRELLLTPWPCNSLVQDKYGTQRVVSFLRQLTEQGGFWRTSDRSWVKLSRVQFVGACNPPTDAGDDIVTFPLS